MLFPLIYINPLVLFALVSTQEVSLKAREQLIVKLTEKKHFKGIFNSDLQCNAIYPRKELFLTEPKTKKGIFLNHRFCLSIAL